MKNHNLSITDELKETDKKIASLIDKRSRLLSRISQTRQQKNTSLTDAQLEKELWKVWKEEMKKSNQSIVRQLFTILNSLGYSRAEKGSSDNPFCLYPPHTVNLNLPAPGSVAQSHFAAFLSMFDQNKLELNNFILNDHIIELIKLANQCGASLSWSDNIFTSQGNHRLNLDGQNLFINHSLFNFYLFICLAIGDANRIKFNSSAQFKTVNLKHLQDFLPQLGARLSSIEPGSYSLPVRLESGAPLPNEISIPDQLDPEFVKALILTAPSYEKGLTIRCNFFNDKGFAELFSTMKETGIQLEVMGNSVEIHPSRTDLKQINIPADPVLSGFLLSMAGLSQGQTVLEGHWQQESSESQAVLQVLEQCGIKTNISSDRISAKSAGPVTADFFDLSEYPSIMPLAFSLCLSSSMAAQTEILMPTETTDYEIAVEILDQTGYDFEAHNRGMRVFSQKKKTKSDPWNSPDPYWTLGYCLLSFRNKGICLANPGKITSIWPGFWRIFTNLTGKKEESKKEEINDHRGDTNEKPARRRIRT
ncbi:MAG: hypothetical protein ABR542_01225 [Desulfonatronovibrio sp.]